MLPGARNRRFERLTRLRLSRERHAQPKDKETAGRRGFRPPPAWRSDERRWPAPAPPHWPASYSSSSCRPPAFVVKVRSFQRLAAWIRSEHFQANGRAGQLFERALREGDRKSGV